MIEGVVRLRVHVGAISRPPETPLLGPVGFQDVEGAPAVDDNDIGEVAHVAGVHEVFSLKVLVQLVIRDGRDRRLPPELVGPV